MPARILVLGGDDPTNINSELNTVSSFFSPDQQGATRNMFQMEPGQRGGSLSDAEGDLGLDLVPERPDFMVLVSGAGAHFVHISSGVYYTKTQQVCVSMFQLIHLDQFS